jgi:hypothetical protein
MEREKAQQGTWMGELAGLLCPLVYKKSNQNNTISMRLLQPDKDVLSIARWARRLPPAECQGSEMSGECYAAAGRFHTA